jgi:cell division control protein 6
MPYGIIVNPDVLEEDYIPQSIPCRESQKKELAFCLSPLQRRMKPFDCLCHGKPGTGKTALVRYLLNQISEATNALCFYVNCWENQTLNQILDELLKLTQIPIVERNNSVKIARLRNKIGYKSCVIALDEVDKINQKELNNILYVLKNLGKVGVVCISNTRKYFLNLDSRITSRMHFKSVSFPPYSNEELLIILKQRLNCKALYPNTCSKEILEKIVDLAGGDARIAIQLLRSSALIAEKANKNKITAEDVDKGYEEVKEIKKKYYLDRLPHHKLIVEIVNRHAGITSTDFYEAYRREARKQGLNPQSTRTFSNYVSELIEMGYLKVDRARTRGNVRVFRVS